MLSLCFLKPYFCSKFSILYWIGGPLCLCHYVRLEPLEFCQCCFPCEENFPFGGKYFSRAYLLSWQCLSAIDLKLIVFFLFRFSNWPVTPVRISKWSVSLRVIFNWPSVVTKNWTRWSRQPLPVVVCYACFMFGFSLFTNFIFSFIKGVIPHIHKYLIGKKASGNAPQKPGA